MAPTGPVVVEWGISHVNDARISEPGHGSEPGTSEPGSGTVEGLVDLAAEGADVA
jgi:hypothetical protein